MRKLFLILVSFMALNVNYVFACEDVTMMPKEFYSLAGRDKCYAAYEQGCSCVINNDGRLLTARKGGDVERMKIAFQVCSKTEPTFCKEIMGIIENPKSTEGVAGWILTPINAGGAQ